MKRIGKLDDGSLVVLATEDELAAAEAVVKAAVQLTAVRRVIGPEHGFTPTKPLRQGDLVTFPDGAQRVVAMTSRRKVRAKTVRVRAPAAVDKSGDGTKSGRSREKVCRVCKTFFTDTSKTNTRKACVKCAPPGKRGTRAKKTAAATGAPTPPTPPPAVVSREARLALIRSKVEAMNKGGA